MSFICFSKVIVEPRKDVNYLSILREMRSLSSKTGLPVEAELNGEKVQITALSNISEVLNSLKSGQQLKPVFYGKFISATDV